MKTADVQECPGPAEDDGLDDEEKDAAMLCTICNVMLIPDTMQECDQLAAFVSEHQGHGDVLMGVIQTNGDFKSMGKFTLPS
ncbi:MAG: hypothetical protein WC683_02840 [bacterium]